MRTTYRDQLVWAEIESVAIGLTETSVSFWRSRKRTLREGLVTIPRSEIRQVTTKKGDISVSELQAYQHVTHIQIPFWLAVEHGLKYED
jgi:hypothetical protein